jgi:hypothetical protein
MAALPVILTVQPLRDVTVSAAPGSRLIEIGLGMGDCVGL